MGKLILQVIGVLLLALAGCNRIPEPKPCGPVPSEAQLNWHQLEYYAFVHFNMNTFTDEEWGFGNEDPSSFNPSELDCRQWVNTFKEAGMKAVIITAKHHDGFCLWPTTTTEHSIKNSPYENGDIIKELSEACKESGLKFGVYLSPWDRNNEYYGEPEYVNIFRQQLRELLTNYGEIFEVWFDGANGGTGYYGGANEKRTIDRETYYDWDKTYDIIRELQPHACIFGDGGPEVRWVGNEEGWAGETNWSTIKHEECYAGMPNYKELSYGHEDGTKWVPAECDVSTRPGWYYHAREDHRVKSLAQMVDIYYHSIGRNASLLVNFPIDRRGLVHENDAMCVRELAEVIRQDFKFDLAAEAEVSATQVRGDCSRFSARKATDGDNDTYWATDDEEKGGGITLQFEDPITFNRFLVQEYIPLGQRVQHFKVEALVDGKWRTLDKQSTIGAKRILRLPTTTSEQIRFTILAAKACPCISNMEIYNAPTLLVEPEIMRNQAGQVTITCADAEAKVFYTIDGSEPDQNSKHYTQPFALTGKQMIKAIASDYDSKKKSQTATSDFDIAPVKWKFLSKTPKNADVMFDGDVNTSLTISEECLTLDLGEDLVINGFTYLPDQSRWGGNYVSSYAFFVSEDGLNWGSPVSSGEFSNIVNNPVKQQKTFKDVSGRYIKFVPKSIERGESAYSIAEFSIQTN
ncbi:MAG: alpha-L-fucosidase [Marinilabiliaceae bacterium]|nr:alpha-L-fucosidase [Marinilabiliaceae bacterium]